MLSSTANYITPLPFMILKQYVEKLELFMAWSEALICFPFAGPRLYEHQSSFEDTP